MNPGRTPSGAVSPGRTPSGAVSPGRTPSGAVSSKSGVRFVSIIFVLTTQISLPLRDRT